MHIWYAQISTSFKRNTRQFHYQCLRKMLFIVGQCISVWHNSRLESKVIIFPFQIYFLVVWVSKIYCQYDECGAAENSGCSDAGKLKSHSSLSSELKQAQAPLSASSQPSSSPSPSPPFTSPPPYIPPSQSLSTYLICLHFHPLISTSQTSLTSPSSSRPSHTSPICSPISPPSHLLPYPLLPVFPPPS